MGGSGGEVCNQTRRAQHTLVRVVCGGCDVRGLRLAPTLLGSVEESPRVRPRASVVRGTSVGAHPKLGVGRVVCVKQ